MMLDDGDYYDIVGIGVFGLGAEIPTGVLNSDRVLQLCWLRRRPLCENSFPSVLFFYHYDIVGIGVFGLGAAIPTGVLNSDRGLQLCWLRRRPLCENSFASILFFLSSSYNRWFPVNFIFSEWPRRSLCSLPLL